MITRATNMQPASLLTEVNLPRVVGQWRDEEDLQNRAQNLREELKLEKLLLTRSEEGMTLFDEDGSWSVPAQAREVLMYQVQAIPLFQFSA